VEDARRRPVLLISEVKAGFGANHARIDLGFGRRRKSCSMMSEFLDVGSRNLEEERSSWKEMALLWL